MATSPQSTTSSIALKYLRLQSAHNVGPVCIQRLIEHFGTIDAVFDASIEALQRVENVGRDRAEAIRRARSDESYEDEIALASKYGVRIICREDESYPPLLKYIHDPPMCLYVRGHLDEQDALAVAVVGSRRCTRYGLEQAERFGALIAGAGFTVISGMARGADAAAHRGALAAGGRTIAVLGCGLAHLYPPEHAELALQIERSGALMSALPMDTPPDSSNFPPRNRIIVGSALGVLVVEAAERSGALISARLATEYNREVFVLPGLVSNPVAAGTNALIRDGGGKLVTCLDDILDELGEAGRLLRPSSTDSEHTPSTELPPMPELSAEERAIIDIVQGEETTLEYLCNHTDLSAAKIASALTKLQMKGLIAQKPGNVFVGRRAR